MDSSEFYRAKSLLASSRSLQEVDRLSGELEAERSRSRLLSQTHAGPCDVRASVAAYFDTACVCFLQSEHSPWLVVGETRVVEAPPSLGNLFEQLSFHEIYIDRKGLVPGEVFSAVDVKRPGSRDMVFVPIGTCVWVFHGKDPGPIVLTIEQHSHWRGFLEAGSSLVNAAATRAAAEQVLRERALRGDLLTDLCNALYRDPVAPIHSTLRGIPGIICSFFGGECNCELFFSDDSGSCMDSSGKRTTETCGLVYAALNTNTMQLCNDPTNKLRSWSVDCGVGSPQGILVLPMWVRGDGSAAIVLRSPHSLSAQDIAASKRVTQDIAQLLEVWFSANRHKLLRPMVGAVDVLTSTPLTALSFIGQSLRRFLESGEHGFEDSTLLSHVSSSLQCDWTVVIRVDLGGLTLVEGDRCRPLSLDETRGPLRDMLRQVTDANGMPRLGEDLVRVLNSVDMKQSGLEAMLGLGKAYCNVCTVHLNGHASMAAVDSDSRVFAVLLCGRVWGALSADALAPAAKCLWEMYTSLLEHRNANVASSSLAANYSKLRTQAEAFRKHIGDFNNAMTESTFLSPQAFRVQLVTALQEFAPKIFSCTLLLFGTLSRSKWALDKTGTWLRDESFVAQPTLSADCLLAYSRKSRRFKVLGDEEGGLEAHVVLEVSLLTDGVFDGDDSTTALATTWLPHLAALLGSYQGKLFECAATVPLEFPVDKLVLGFKSAGVLRLDRTTIFPALCGQCIDAIEFVLPLHVNSRGDVFDVDNVSRLLPAALRVFTLARVGERATFSVLLESGLCATALEYISQAATRSFALLNLTLVLHVYPCSNSSAVAALVLYRSDALVAPCHIRVVQQGLQEAGGVYLALFELNPHIVSMSKFKELSAAHEQSQIFLNKLARRCGVLDTGEGALQAISFRVDFTSRFLRRLLDDISSQGLHERATAVLRSEALEVMLQTNSSACRGDLVVHWCTSWSAGEDASRPPATAGVVSEDMLELVRASGRALELDLQDATASRQNLQLETGEGMRTRDVRVNYNPVLVENSGAAKVAGVVQFISSTAAPQDSETILLQTVHECLRSLGARLRPSGDELLQSNSSPLGDILSRLASSNHVTELNEYMQTEFIDTFSAYVSRLLQSDCVLLSPMNPTRSGDTLQFQGLPHLVTGGLERGKPCVIPLAVLEGLCGSVYYSLLSQSLLSGERVKELYGLACALPVDSRNPSKTRYLLLETRMRPSFFDVDHFKEAVAVYEHVVGYAATQNARLLSRQSLLYETFCRQVMLSDEADHVAALVNSGLFEALHGISTSLVFPQRLTAEAADRLLAHSQLHASRASDDRLGALCLLSKTHLDCRHGTLSSPLPCVFFPLLYVSHEDDEEVEEAFASSALKVCFADAAALERFLASSKQNDPLLRYMDRAEDACKCIRAWAGSHMTEKRFRLEREVANHTRVLMNVVSEMLARVSGAVMAATEVAESAGGRGEGDSIHLQAFSMDHDQSHSPRVDSLPSLAAYIAATAEDINIEVVIGPIQGARLHWAMADTSMAGDDNWQTCQRPDEVDPALYFRIDRANAAFETVMQIRASSPSKRAARRSWTHSRSTISRAHLRAIQEKRFLLTRSSDLPEGAEEVLWVWVELLSEYGAQMVLELRLPRTAFASIARPFFRESVEGAREQLFAVGRSSQLYSKLLLAQQILGGIAVSVLRLAREVSALVAEKALAAKQELLADILAGCMRGLLGARSAEGGSLRDSLESVLAQLCRLPGVVEICVECTDSADRALLFKSSARREAGGAFRAEVEEYSVAGAGGTLASTNSQCQTQTQSQIPEFAEPQMPAYSLDKCEFALDCHEVKGNLTVELDGRGDALQTSVLELIARALARRVYEMNRARKSKVALRKKADELATAIGKQRVLEEVTRRAEESAAAMSRQQESLVEEKHRLQELLNKANADILAAAREKKSIAAHTSQAIEEHFGEHKKKKAQLIHSISVLEGELAEARSSQQILLLERNQAQQSVAVAALKLQEAHEDHEQMLTSLKTFKTKKVKECAGLQQQCNGLLAKLSSTENELLGTRRLYEQKKTAAEDAKTALLLTQAELTDLKERLNLA